jgi:hypothetical protein
MVTTTSNESQPEQLADTSGPANIAAYSILGAGGGMLLITIAIFALSVRLDLFDFSKLDIMYSGQHHKDTRPKLESTTEKWRELDIREWKNGLGGFCFLLTLILAATIVVLLVVPATMDSLMETTSLVPNLAFPLASRQIIRSQIKVSLAFNGFMDTCVASGATVSPPGSTCDPLMSFRVTNLGSNLGTGITCEAQVRACIVTFTCSNCSMDADLASVSISAAQNLAFAHSLAYTVSTTTGHQPYNAVATPDGLPSIISGLLQAPTADYVFRGSAPSVVSLGASYSVFQAPPSVTQSGL